ncbi:MAG: XdhC family protein [Pseudomonadota bacterium]|nr:XdhC family protein [Pseudomonadota bacterium]
MTTHEHALSSAARLQQEGRSFALVTVLRAEAPASARPGDKAVVTEDGQLHGWVGGGCAQPAVLRTVREALADGRARTIRIAPASAGQQRELGDVLEFGMSCHSGGTLELFVDPVLARPLLVVIGHSPVAMALCDLAPRVGFAVTVVAQDADVLAFPEAQQVIASDAVEQVLPGVPAGAWVVVATQGRRDLQGLRLAIALRARQVAFVASARKAGVLRQALLGAGECARAVAAIVAPAGYPIAASTPEEIALSALAAIVAERRGGLRAAPPAEAVEDPATGNAPAAEPDATGPAAAPEPAPTPAPAGARSPCCGGGL